MKIDSSITHTPKAMPTNAILTIGTDTARVPSPFNNLRAIKNSKFTNLVAFIHYTKVLFSIQFDKIKGFCFTNLYIPRILRKTHLPGHSRMPCPRHFPYPHKTLRFPHFPDRRFKDFTQIVRPAIYYDNPGSNRTAYIPDTRKKFSAFKFRLQSPTVSPSPKNKHKQVAGRGEKYKKS